MQPKPRNNINQALPSWVFDLSDDDTGNTDPLLADALDFCAAGLSEVDLNLLGRSPPGELHPGGYQVLRDYHDSSIWLPATSHHTCTERVHEGVQEMGGRPKTLAEILAKTSPRYMGAVSKSSRLERVLSLPRAMSVRHSAGDVVAILASGDCPVVLRGEPERGRGHRCKFGDPVPVLGAMSGEAWDDKPDDEMDVLFLHNRGWLGV